MIKNIVHARSVPNGIDCPLTMRRPFNILYSPAFKSLNKVLAGTGMLPAFVIIKFSLIRMIKCMPFSSKNADCQPTMNSRSPNRHLIFSTLKILIVYNT